MTTQTLPLGPYEHDDTPTGHSFAAAWWTRTGFCVLSATLVVGLIGEAAIFHFFG